MMVAAIGYLPASLIVIAVALMTYAMRASVIVGLGERALPAPVERGLRYVGPAVLAALTVSLAAGSSDGGPPSISAVEVGALVVASLVAWKTRQLIAVLLAGMAIIWLGAAFGW